MSRGQSPVNRFYPIRGFLTLLDEHYDPNSSNSSNSYPNDCLSGEPLRPRSRGCDWLAQGDKGRVTVETGDWFDVTVISGDCFGVSHTKSCSPTYEVRTLA
jgi:hypothetical protein